jgi:peptide/nickel transport system substrate-binding protein
VTRNFLIVVAIVSILIMVVTGCGGKTATTTAQTTTAPQTSAATTSTPAQTSSTTTTPAAPQPVSGGVLRIVTGGLAACLGYPPQFAPADSIQMQPILERLCYWQPDGSQTGLLAQSWDITETSLTWHLREGVKFFDGTDFDAETLKWNYELGIANKRISDADKITSIEVVDKYTLKLNLTKYNIMMLTNFGWGQQISPTAFKKGGDTDEKRIEWARLHPVGTGPFMLAENGFVRDTSIKMIKNPNYWQKGMPYLDGIEINLIPDTMVAAAKLEAKQADMWIDAANVQNIIDLESKGIKSNWGPGMFNLLLYNSTDPNSPTSKKEVRQAIESAINRPALAKMLGSGKYEALSQMAASKFPGYVAGYDPYPYNPTKAKELLAKAGYPNGFKTKLMITSSGADAGAGIKAYLDAVGIETTLDIADLGRYFGELFGTGYTDDLVLTASGINPDATDIFVHFANNPMTFRTKNIYKSPEYLALADQALYSTDPAKAISLTRQAIKQAGEDALFCPLYRTVANAEMQPYVHSDYFMIHGATWTPWDDWMDKH